jgi:hypothetical protein
MNPGLIRSAFCTRRGVLAAAISVVAAGGPAYAAATLPEIRLSAGNPVPSCVTPDRLMAFLKRRNGSLSPRFGEIATYYKRHGEAWHVRWDYAFFQMAIETNFLTYRAPSGRMGDVDPKQNNFAGIGTTGGGVPGDSFPDVSTGVLGQIQHLVVYSGEMVPNPVAPRTQLKQEHILEKSRSLNRPVRFSDLAKRWAADPKYGGSIEWVAERFRGEMCRGRQAPQDVEVLPWEQTPADGGRASAPETIKPGSPVRTVWARGQGPQTAAAPQPKPKPQRKVVAANAAAAPSLKAVKAAAPPKVQAPAAVKPLPAADVASPNSASEPVPAPPSASATEPAASEPEFRFALFSPPAALAEVTVPTASVPRAEREAPAAAVASNVPELPVTPLPDVKPVETHSVTVPPLVNVPPLQPSDSQVADVAVAAAAPTPEAAPAAAKPAFDPPSGLGMKSASCVVETATYGGETTVLLKTAQGADVHYVALSVLDGFEDSMTKSFLAARPEGGEALGTFPSKTAALERARALCPE